MHANDKAFNNENLKFKFTAQGRKSPKTCTSYAFKSVPSNGDLAASTAGGGLHNSTLPEAARDKFLCAKAAIARGARDGSRNCCYISLHSFPYLPRQGFYC